MKVKGASKVHYDSGPNMTPLVDVVMVILIFLMLAGKFGDTEQYLASNVPVRKGGSGGVTSKIPDDTDLRITVDAQADRFQACVANERDQTVTDEETLKALLRGQVAAFKTNGTDIDKVQVIIAPGRFVKYMYLIQVYEAANDAGFTKVAFEDAH